MEKQEGKETPPRENPRNRENACITAAAQHQIMHKSR